MVGVRLPTGEAGYPNLLVEGKEGAGKTYAACSLSADPRVGMCYVVEVGERRADEYAVLGDFQIVEHDGSLREIVEAIELAMSLPPLEGRPNVLVVDSMTGLWDLVKKEAERIARSSKSAKERIEKDPFVEIEIGHQAWDKAKNRHWWQWLNALRSWPGIAVLTARADEVAKFQDGKPVAGQTDYRVDVEKGTPFALDATVRFRGDVPPLVTTKKSLMFTLPPGGLVLPVEAPLAHLVFDLFAAGTEVVLNVAQAKGALMATAKGLGHDGDAAARACSRVWEKYGNRQQFGGDVMALMLTELEKPGELELAEVGADA